MIAFFDLDRTLLSVNSGSLWVRRETRLGHVRRRDAVQAAGWLLGYHLGVADMEQVLVRAIASLAGSPRDDLVERTRAFYREEIQHQVRPGARSIIAEHRARGDGCVILTGSSGYLSDLFVAQLGLDASLCNRFEVDAQGRHTGRSIGPVCYGHGKVLHARAYAEARGVALADCTFYTDSYSDLPVMEQVSRPVAVHPDPRLRRTARRRGWAIADWSAATPRLDD